MMQTVKTQAWLTSPENNTRASLLEQEPACMIGNLCFYDVDMTDSGWVRFADAAITLDILPGSETDAAQIAVLEKEIKEATEKFNFKVEKMEQLINSLKRLPNFVNEPVPNDLYQGEVVDDRDDFLNN